MLQLAKHLGMHSLSALTARTNSSTKILIDLQQTSIHKALVIQCTTLETLTSFRSSSVCTEIVLYEIMNKMSSDFLIISNLLFPFD